MIIFTNLDSDFFLQEIYQILSSKWFHFGPLETVVCMAFLKSFSHLKHKWAAMQRHQKTNKNSRNPNPKHANQTSNNNTTEHELKYSEASRSSFLKLVFGNLNLKEAMQLTTQTYYIHG